MWGPWVFYMYDASQVFHEKAEKKGGGAFLPAEPKLLEIA